MNMNDLHANAEDMLGKTIYVEGFFIFVEQNGYVVASLEEYDDKKNALKIDMPDLKKLMMDHVPPRVGSRYYYADEAMIEGRFEKYKGDEFKYCLCNLTKLEITQCGDKFIVIS